MSRSLVAAAGAAALAASLAAAQPFPVATLPPSAVTAPFADEVVRRSALERGAHARLRSEQP
jgi:hypothetical protein